MVETVVWCDRGWLPPHFGFCPSEKAWKREMKRFKCDAPYPETDARCTTFDNPNGGVCFIVTVAERVDAKEDQAGIAALIVHEAMHVWRGTRENIGEQEPSSEFEAYAMQNIFMGLYAAYLKTRTDKVAKP